MNKNEFGFLYAMGYGALAQFNHTAADVVFYLCIAGAAVFCIMGTKVSEMAGNVFGDERDKITAASIAKSCIYITIGLLVGHIAMAAALAVFK